MSEPRTVCHTPTPGKKPTTIPSWKYAAVRNAILEIVPRAGAGIVAKDLPQMVSMALTPQDRDRLGSVTWHTTTVKLNMEVAGELQRVEGARPQRLLRI